jgi:hypothetical protein
MAGSFSYACGYKGPPVTDGVSVLVFFNSGTLAALDLEGKVRWQTTRCHPRRS